MSYLYESESEFPGTIYYAKELEEIYLTLLKCHDIYFASHVTRFSDCLVEAILELKKCTVDNKVTVFFECTLNILLRDHIEMPDEFTESIKEVVVPIRNSIKMVKNKFDGEFQNEGQKRSVPIELLVLISMLIDGVSIDNKGFSQEVHSVSQLIVYHFGNRKTLEDGTYSRKRHPKHLETPLPIYIALKIYATVRSRILIDILFSLGICVSYSRVLEITKYIGMKAIHKYEKYDCYIPDNIKSGIFTVLAKDNIDLNARSTIIKSHFYGISMSILQFPSYSNPGQPQDYDFDGFDSISNKSKKIPSLPAEYKKVQELSSYNKTPLFSPVCTVNVKCDEIGIDLDIAKMEELKWLDLMIDTSSVEMGMAWSKYHATANRADVETPGISSI